MPVFLDLSASHKSSAVTSNIPPTKAMLPPKKDSNSSSKSNPTTTAGSIEITIFDTNCVFSFQENFNNEVIISTMSFLKTTMVLNAVAK